MSKPPLSFKAQAVLDAVKNELDHAPWELSYLAGSSAAAALRAAADEQCRPSDWRPPFGSDEIDAAEWWLAGYEAAVEEIKARFDLIAAELEGHHG